MTQMHTDKLKYTEFIRHISHDFHEDYTEFGGGLHESVYEKAMTLVLQQQELQIKTKKRLLFTFVEA